MKINEEESLFYQKTDIEHICDKFNFYFELTDGSVLPDFFRIMGNELLIQPTLDTHVGVYRIKAYSYDKEGNIYYQNSFRVIVYDENDYVNGLVYGIYDERKINSLPSSFGFFINPEFKLAPNEDPLSFEIIEITENGRVLIEFSKEMQSPKELQHYHKNRVLILNVLSTQLTEEKRKRAVKSWLVQEYKDQFMELRITWDEPYLISNISKEKDILLVTVANEAYFASKAGELVFPGFTSMEEVPPQLSFEETEEIETIASFITAMMAVSGIAAVFMNIFLATALQLVWKMLGAIQLIVHLPLLNLEFPRNARLCFQLVIDLANFKIVPVDWILGKAQKVNDFGYSASFASSLGIIFIFVITTGIMCLVGLIVYKAFQKNDKIKKILELLANKLLFNSFIRTYIQGYLVFCIAAFSGVKYLVFETPFSVLDSFLALFLTLTVYLTPISSFLFLKKSQKLLHLDKMKNRVHSLYLDLKIYKIKALAYYPLFIGRRLVLATLITFVAWSPTLQLQAFMVSCIYVLIYTFTVGPFIFKMLNFLDFINELIILSMSYICFAYSLFIPEQKLRHQIGWAMIYLFLSDFIINILIIFISLFSGLFKVLSKKFCKMSQKRKSMKKKKKLEARRSQKNLQTEQNLLTDSIKFQVKSSDKQLVNRLNAQKKLELNNFASSGSYSKSQGKKVMKSQLQTQKIQSYNSSSISNQPQNYDQTKMQKNKDTVRDLNFLNSDLQDITMKDEDISRIQDTSIASLQNVNKRVSLPLHNFNNFEQNIKQKPHKKSEQYSTSSKVSLKQRNSIKSFFKKQKRTGGINRRPTDLQELQQKLQLEADQRDRMSSGQALGSQFGYQPQQQNLFDQTQNLHDDQQLKFLVRREENQSIPLNRPVYQTQNKPSFTPLGMK